MLSSIYTTSRSLFYFCLSCSDQKFNCSGFLFLSFERSLLKSSTKFLRLLSAVCFRNLFENRIVIFLMAIVSLVSFLSLSVF